MTDDCGDLTETYNGDTKSLLSLACDTKSFSLMLKMFTGYVLGCISNIPKLAHQYPDVILRFSWRKEITVAEVRSLVLLLSFHLPIFSFIDSISFWTAFRLKSCGGPCKVNSGGVR